VPVTAIVGAQWGDEGKGKITDLLARSADIVIRFGGGSNAGHTVVNEYGTFRLHLVPSGIFNSRALNITGTGTVVDLDFLESELEELRMAGVSAEQLVISNRAHLIMPYHVLLDQLEEEARGKQRIGTTRRGVGPAYADKVNRLGLRAGDLLDWPSFKEKLCFIAAQKNRLLQRVYDHPGLDLDDLLTRADTWRTRYAHRIVDTVPLLAKAIQADQSILLEGQLGVMRDLDWGIYPYVTSSTTFAGGGAPGAGIPPALITDVLGVVKAYTTAVGEGPLPTELHGAEADALRERGQEYGATTGRSRRVGWFDGVAMRYAATVNRFTRIAVTKLDVLDGIDPLRIAVAYRVGDTLLDTVTTTTDLWRAEPVYEEWPGWSVSTAGVRRWEDLPANAQRYLNRIAELASAPIDIISVGQDREATIIRPGFPSQRHRIDKSTPACS
jgi:adenylosuccinate synthase